MNKRFVPRQKECSFILNIIFPRCQRRNIFTSIKLNMSLKQETDTALFWKMRFSSQGFLSATGVLLYFFLNGVFILKINDKTFSCAISSLETTFGHQRKAGQEKERDMWPCDKCSRKKSTIHKLFHLFSFLPVLTLGCSTNWKKPQKGTQ